MKTNSIPIAPPAQLVSIAVAEDGSVVAAGSGTLYQAVQGSKPWTRMPGGLTSLSAASDGTVLGVNVSGVPGTCYEFTDGKWKPAYLGLPPTAQMAQISVVSNSVVWALDSEGNAYQYSSGAWLPVPLPNLPLSTILTIIQAAPDAVWALDSSGKIWSFDSLGENWSPVATPGGVGMISLSLSLQSWAWGIDSENKVWQYSGASDGWISRPAFGYQGAHPQFICTSDDTTTWGLDSTNVLFSYHLGENTWTQMLSTASFKVLAVADGLSIWALDTQGDVYAYSANAISWTEFAASNYIQVSAQSASSAWVLDSSNNVYVWNPATDTFASVNSSTQPLVQISGGVDGTLWGVGTDRNPYQYNGSSFVYKAVPNAVNKIVQMAVGSQEVIYALDNGGRVYQYLHSAWQVPLSLTGATDNQLIDIAAASDGSLFAVDDLGYIYQYLSGQDFTAAWHQICYGFTQIAVGSNSNVWCLANGDPRQLTPGGGESPRPASWTRSAACMAPDWDTASPTDETLSTHLWIVNKASALAFEESKVGEILLDTFSQPGFLANMTQGLYDADFKDEYTNTTWPGFPTYISHFYDPDTHLNYLGLSSPTALTEGRKYFHKSVALYGNREILKAGYFLGVSLHYLTDLTQPMHAANFNALSSFPVLGPWGYHSVFENHAMAYQGSVTPPAAYTDNYRGLAPDEYLIQAAINSKTYYNAICPWSVFLGWYGQLWDDLTTTIDEQLGPILTDAINITSQYIVAWGYNIRFMSSPAARTGE